MTLALRTMKRREFIALIGGMASAWPLAARGQQSKVNRIAWVHPSAPLDNLRSSTDVRAYRAFQDELRQLGHIEGTNLTIERYSGAGRLDLYDTLARTVVRSRPSLVFTSGVEMARGLKAATTRIPIVAILNDPVAAGLIDSLAHPGGNITGAAVDAGIEIWTKRLGLLREAVPHATRVGLLSSPGYWEITGRAGEALRAAAPLLGLSVVSCSVDEAAEPDYRRAFATAQQNGVSALLVHDQAENFTNRKLIIELTRQTNLPTIYPYREYVELGGLMAYAVDLPDAFRHGAQYVDQILKGANPADLPFYQQSRFQFLINLKTAKNLNLNLTTTLVASADGVIE
ncbi:ABC transporter substrate-binding protein [Rhodoplanes sp. Z2-YC6860]|uniref:ABC transporter substrate-binding protein n=1 Tax=Rhodoplanes sp. Z2-YC6860 TaxID=674703 RepID=UPI00078B35B9|nr:ABC transporter substrate-binding protein [Rhodoplanes sp. Z2-YC6860]AMN42145.1 ABC transporter substrate binding protein [Rhodoplanes sp. Z2-YC6860]